MLNPPAPNKLSIIDPTAITAVYGRNSTALKGPFSNLTHPRENLNTTRSKPEHARRRKHWDRAFTSPTLRSYLPLVNKHTARLLTHLQARAGEVINASLWLALYSYDLLFDVGFSQDMNRLACGREDFHVVCAQNTLKLSGILIHTPWVAYFSSFIPTLGKEFEMFRAHSQDLVDERLALSTAHNNHKEKKRDIFSFIAQSYDEIPQKTPQDVDNLAGDADLLVLAGSDSIAGATASIVYELAMNPHEQDRLRRELAGVQNLQRVQLKGHSYLDAVIWETLRLNPPAPAGHERMTPAEGVDIGEGRVPGNVIVCVPHYATFRDPRFFVQPNDFIPERWTSRQDLNMNPTVFIPFQTGGHACPGRNLAFKEMRTVVFEVVKRYKISSASQRIKREFLGGRDDRWLLGVGELNIVLMGLEE